MAERLPPDGMNRCFFQGYVGQDPDIRENVNTKTGDQFVAASFSLGINSSYRDGNGQRVARPTVWPKFNVVGKLAEVVRDYVEKGQQLTIISAYNVRKDDRNPEKPAYYHEFLLDQYGCQLFMGPKSGNGGNGSGNVDSYKAKVLANMKLQDWTEDQVEKLQKLLDVTAEAEKAGRETRQRPSGQQEIKPKVDLDDDIPFGV